MIKQIRQEAETELAKLFDYRIHLQLQVKVDPSWRKDESSLSRLIS